MAFVVIHQSIETCFDSEMISPRPSVLQGSVVVLLVVLQLLFEEQNNLI